MGPKSYYVTANLDNQNNKHMEGDLKSKRVFAAMDWTKANIYPVWQAYFVATFPHITSHTKDFIWKRDHDLDLAHPVIS